MTTKVKSEFLDSAIISDHTQVSAASADHVLIHDASDNTLKKALISTITGTASVAADDISTGDGAVTIATSSGNITINNGSSDDDIVFIGNDGGQPFTAVRIDMSDAGRALFNGSIDIGGTAITKTGDLTLDVSGDITLDAGGDNIKFHDSGTEVGQIDLGSQNLTFRSSVSDKDMIFRVNDGGSEIVALTIDASEEGNATFNNNVIFGDNGKAIFGAGTDLAIFSDGTDGKIEASGTLILDADGTTISLRDGGTENSQIGLDSAGLVMTVVGADKDFFVAGDDGGTAITAFRADMSDAGRILAYGGVNIEANTDISFTQGTWTGEKSYKIQAHSGNLYLQSDYFFFRDAGGTNNASIDSSGNAIFLNNVTAYGTPSDIKLKEDIEVIDNAVDKVKQLKGVTYTLKSDGNRLTGLIAQDLEKVLPEAVYTSETIPDEINGIKSEEHLAIRYGNTVGLLVEAIKELEARVKELESK